MFNRTVLLIDWDNYLSRLFYTNNISEGTWKEKKILVKETIEKNLKIFNFLQNLLDYWIYDEIIFIFDTKTGKANNIKILDLIIKKYNIDSKWYKWQREKRNDFDKFKQVFQNLLFFKWFKIVTSDKYEADDVIATYSLQYNKAAYNVHILSKDNDMYQILSDTIVIVDGIGKKDRETPLTESKMKLKFKLKKKLRINNSEDIILIKAIIWDKSDNIIGVKWIAEWKLAKAMWENLTIRETDIYLNNKEYIDELSKVIQLNTNIDESDLKINHWPINLTSYNNYLEKIKKELS